MAAIHNGKKKEIKPCNDKCQVCKTPAVLSLEFAKDKQSRKNHSEITGKTSKVHTDELDSSFCSYTVPGKTTEIQSIFL